MNKNCQKRVIKIVDNLELRVTKRIGYLSDSEVLRDAIDKLKVYNVSFYNSEGSFCFNDFKRDCIKTSEVLIKNDKPVNGIRYQFCDFLSAIQTIVGNRNFIEFII